MKANAVIGFVESNLGLTEAKWHSSNILYARLGAVIRRVQDRELSASKSANVTLTDQGSYPIEGGAEAILSITWPGRYKTTLQTDPDILSETTGSSSNPRWVTPNELRAYQRLIDDNGGGPDVPIIWSHEKEDSLILMIAPTQAIIAGEIVRMRVSLVSDAVYDGDTDIEGASEFEMYIKYLACEDAAQYASGKMASSYNLKMADWYSSRSLFYRNMAIKELESIKQAHNPMTQHAEIKRVDTPSLPPTYE